MLARRNLPPLAHIYSIYLPMNNLMSLPASLHLRWEPEDLKYLQRWFDQAALCEIALILQAIDACNYPTIFDFLRICLSNILRAVSWQKNDDLPC